jgi:Domain of unknown function (DUF4292)
MSKLYGQPGMNPALLFSLAAVLILGAAGCKTRQNAVPPVVKEAKKPEDKTAPDLQQLIAANSFNARTFTAKAAVQSIVGGQDNSFNINLRLCTDSAIWISISPLLGIEVARVLVTRDSVKFIDRLNKKYSVSDFQFLNDLLQVNVDFDIIQGVLTGNLFAYKKNKFNSVYIEDRYYILSTLSKRKLKRSLEDVDISKPIVQDLWVDGSNYRITRLNVEDQRLNKTLLTDYADHRQTEGGLFPFKSKTVITAGKTLKIDIEYQKLTLNNDIDFPFTIPAGYERIQ